MISVSVEIPVSEPEKVEKPEGNPAQIEKFAGKLHAAIGNLEEYADNAKRKVRDDSWYGDAASAYAKLAKKIGNRHEDLADALKQVSRACAVHAETLEDLLREWRRIVDRKKQLDGRREQLWADTLAAQNVEDEVIKKLQHRALQLTEAYADLVADYKQMRKRTRENEQLMIRAFARNDTEREVRQGSRDPLAVAALNKPGAAGSGATPKEVRAWWGGLTLAEKHAVAAADPRLIGRTDGIPARWRDLANRMRLTEDIKVMETQKKVGELSDYEKKVLRNVLKAEAALNKADNFIDRTGPGAPFKPGGQLYLYEPTAFQDGNGEQGKKADGKIAIAIGDLDTAEDIAVRVPGITNDASKAVKLTGEALNVYQSARYEGDGSSVASMFWMGYDAPDSISASETRSDERARDGGKAFADTLEGLRASRPDDRANLTAIGHSYGSAAVAQSLARYDADADQAVLVGSPGPGGGIKEAADLKIGSDNVFVATNSRDLVGNVGDNGAVGFTKLTGQGLGIDPADDAFGARRVQAEDPSRGRFPDIKQHGRYFKPNTESLYNIGRIVDGQSQDINEAELIEDPWWRTANDPEWDRKPTEPKARRKSLTEDD